MPKTVGELTLHYPPEADVMDTMMQVMAMSGDRGLAATTGGAGFHLFDLFMAESKVRVELMCGRLTYNQAREARATKQFSAKVQQPAPLRGALRYRRKQNPREKRGILSKQEMWKVMRSVSNGLGMRGLAHHAHLTVQLMTGRRAKDLQNLRCR